MAVSVPCSQQKLDRMESEANMDERGAEQDSSTCKNHFKVQHARITETDLGIYALM